MIMIMQEKKKKNLQTSNIKSTGQEYNDNSLQSSSLKNEV
jgi:hypothetical protein